MLQVLHDFLRELAGAPGGSKILAAIIKQQIFFRFVVEEKTLHFRTADRFHVSTLT